MSAATNVLSSVTGDTFQEDVDHAFTNYDYYNYDQQDYSYNGYYSPTGYYSSPPYELNYRHLPYDEKSYQTNFKISEHQVIPPIETVLSDDSSDLVEKVHYKKSKKKVHPIYAAEEESYTTNEDLNTIKSEPEPVIANLSDPDKSSPSIPYVVYSEEHNPWDFLETGLSTDHIYKPLV